MIASENVEVTTASEALAGVKTQCTCSGGGETPKDEHRDGGDYEAEEESSENVYNPIQ